MSQLVFVPVALGSTFYSLRAARAHDKLTVVVVVSSIALVAGSRVWSAVYRAFGVRGMLVGSALMSSAAAAGCLVAETSGLWSSGAVLAVVFGLATMSGQAVYTASITWVGNAADPRERSALISAGATVVALTTCLAGALVGQIALDHSTHWPVIAMLVLSVLAYRVARCAPAR